MNTYHSAKMMKLDKLTILLAVPVAIALVISFSLVAGVTMGFAWEGVCFLRSFGSPDMISDKVPSVLNARDFHNNFLNQVGVMLDLYNSYFPNNMRYGSGLGFIGGAIISLLLVQKIFKTSWSSWKFRYICGATAGAIIGGRLDLVFNSDPIPFLVALTLFSILVGIFAAFLTSSSLPHVKLLFGESQVCRSTDN